MSDANETIRKKSILMTMFARDMERLIAPKRITVEMLRSDDWLRRQKEYMKLFWDLVPEKGKRDVGNSVSAGSATGRGVPGVDRK